jgi:hypothetical protein
MAELLQLGISVRFVHCRYLLTLSADEVSLAGMVKSIGSTDSPDVFIESQYLGQLKDAKAGVLARVLILARKNRV